VSERPGDLRSVEAKYEARAALDPLRAVLDAGDPDNRKNAFVDYLERRCLARALGGARLPVVVDLGCGVGRFFPLLAPRCHRLLGIDVTEALLRVARTAGAGGAAGLIRGSATGIPLRDGTADLVLCCNVLIHVVEEDGLASVASEVRRILRPGGRFVAIEHISPSAVSERREGIVYRSRSDFRGAFTLAGLSILEDRPVRKVPSRVIHWVRLGRLPRPLWAFGAALESLLAPRGSEAPSYRDHLFVMERSRSAV